jgi:hypothetical protein
MWQWLVVLACVLFAAAYVARSAWRTWHPKPGNCSGGCGCATTNDETSLVTLIPAEQLKVRRR